VIAAGYNPDSNTMITRKNLLQKLKWGVLAGAAGNGMAHAAPQVDDWHAELTKRIAALAARGGGTLELGDGVYEIDKPLRIPREVSLLMTPNAVIRAKQGFEGDAVVIKGGGKYSVYSATAGWIRGGVIDANRQPLTGIRVEDLHRFEIADLSVLNALYKGIHITRGGNETNLSRVRCDVDMRTKYAPESIGVHVQRTDCKFTLIHVIGYETGVRSDAGSNWFSQIHVWNWVPTQGPMKYCFYCNGSNNKFSQCYADSPSIAGFYIARPQQSVMQCGIYYSRWADDNTGVGILIAKEGRNGTYVGNTMMADKAHRLAKAFDGDLDGSLILGTSGWGVVGGLENRIPSGSSAEHPAVNFAGSGVRLTPQAKPPSAEEGASGELRWVEDGNTSALWLKTPRGWKKADLV
jgi:hypothetical protein